MRVPPIATYRVQLSGEFGFNDLIDQLDYLRDLGVSHVYASPILQAASGSSHGYDVVDCTRVNAELGGEEGLRLLSRELEARGMGLLLDIVPNHMSIDDPANFWWQDVLENGPVSRYARFFDIAWEGSGSGGGKVLAPLLGDHVGRELEDGSIRLEHEKGRFYIACCGRRMPLSPETTGGLLREACDRHPWDDLEFLARSLQNLPRPQRDDLGAIERRDRDRRVLYSLIEEFAAGRPDFIEALDQVAKAVNTDLDRLDELLRMQSYRLAYWRLAAQQLGYRRFFDVNTLVALRAGAPEVFEATHRELLRLFREGRFGGFRVDHVDGIRHPPDYLQRLRDAAPEAWIVVEKILEPEEALPAAWPVEGTTGYDFLFDVNNLFVDPSAEGVLTELYREFSGGWKSYDELKRESKRLVLRNLFGSDLRRLLSLLHSVCDRYRRHRDYLETELQEAVEEFVAALPVYRTYIDPAGPSCSERDAEYVEEAIESAKSSAPQLDSALFDLLRDLLLLRLAGDLEADFVVRLQQLTGPATAKGVEDTVFYRYHRLVALNEVGGDPSRFGLSAAEFHERAKARLSRQPLTLNATSTHDTKRSEDVRARICQLTEIPQRWSEAVRAWARSNQKHRSGDLPDRKMEYLFYQTVVGAWPIDGERCSAFMLKAAREAKERTEWTRPNPAYEQALLSFVESALADEEFRRGVEQFAAELHPASWVASLSQTLIKLTAPGVPDIYQGSELWHLRLVDPDNRGPVDYGVRRRLLGELESLRPDQILNRMEEGLPKLWLIRQALALRRERPGSLGTDGAYQPLAVTGSKADCLVAYLRGDDIAALAPRLPRSTSGGWADTEVELPLGEWRGRLGGGVAGGGRQPADALLREFPVELYVREGVA